MKEYDITKSYVGYNKNALNQAKASEILISLLKLKGNESILDIGCGTGSSAKEMSEQTTGMVLGIDSSKGMIEQANLFSSTDDNLRFKLSPVESMGYKDQFDIVFCNSVFHWFKNPKLVLKKVLDSLHDGGILALQVPLKNWCPVLTLAIGKTCASEKIFPFYKSYKSPWFHLNNSQEYSQLLLDGGFTKTIFAEDSFVTNEDCNNEKIFNMFMTGPSGAYLNPENYHVDLPHSFNDLFFDEMKKQIRDINPSNRIDVIYHRGFIVSKK